MQQIGQLNQRIEATASANRFIHIAKYLMAARGDVQHALKLAEGRGAQPEIIQVLKSAVAGGTIAHSTWAAPIAQYEATIAAFLDSLQNFGAFDSMLGAMRRVPLRTRIGVVTVGATGAIIGEGQVTPISNLTLGGKQLDEAKAVVMMALTAELSKLMSPESTALFGRELRHGIALETDREFIARITDGITPIQTNGGTAIGIRQDIAEALEAMDTDAASQLFVLVESSTAKSWATKTTSIGSAAFDTMTPQGGSVCGMPVIVTNGVTAGTAVFADANQIAAGGGSIELDSSGQADLHSNSVPDSPPSASAVMTSLWQTNQIALKAVRYFGAERLRDTAVAVIAGLGYSGNSPA